MGNLKLFTLPNILTGLNLFFGCIACINAYEGNYQTTLIFIIISAICDFFDGMSARVLKISSPIGKELDSLADDISFGFAPSLICFSMLKEANYSICLSEVQEFIPYLSFAIAVFSAFRLAKFNLDERQSTSFIGLPTPANALFWSSMAIGVKDINPFVILVLIIIFSWLLISEIPMFSLKFKNLSIKDNKIKYIFIITSIPIIIIWGFSGIASVIGWYIILSVILNSFSKKQL